MQDSDHISLFQLLPERGEGRGGEADILVSGVKAPQGEHEISPPLSRKSADNPFLIHVYTDTEESLTNLRLPFPSPIPSYRDTDRGAIIAPNSLPFSLGLVLKMLVGILATNGFELLMSAE